MREGGKMIRRDKKGQAAMEFLMTYGWAILAAVLAIGALASFGVFSQGSSANLCVLNPPLNCDEKEVTTSGVRLIISNGAGYAITTSNVSVTGCGTNLTAFTISDGGDKDILVSCSPGSSGSSFNGKLEITYLGEGKTITEKSTGNIKVEIK